MDEEAVRLAAVAHIRHWETKYDELLALGHDWRAARTAVADVVLQTLESGGLLSTAETVSFR